MTPLPSIVNTTPITYQGTQIAILVTPSSYQPHPLPKLNEWVAAMQTAKPTNGRMWRIINNETYECCLGVLDRVCENISLCSVYDKNFAERTYLESDNCHGLEDKKGLFPGGIYLVIPPHNLINNLAMINDQFIEILKIQTFEPIIQIIQAIYKQQ